MTAEDGVYYATTSGATLIITYDVPPAFPSDRIDFAISDTRGGVIIHPDRAPFTYKGNASIVYKVPKGSNSFVQMLVPAASQGLQLEDVVKEGSDVKVYYTRLQGSMPDDMLQTLRKYDFDAKTVVQLAEVAGWESGTWNYSVGGGLIAHQWGAEGWTGFTWRDDTGANINWPHDPTGGGEMFCEPNCYWAVALSPDGSKVARAQRVAGVYWVTIVNMIDGSLVKTFALPGGIYGVHSIDYGNGYMVVNRVEEGSEWYINPLVINLAGGGAAIDSIPLNGLARLTDVIPALNGVPSWP